MQRYMYAAPGLTTTSPAVSSGFKASLTAVGQGWIAKRSNKHLLPSVQVVDEGFWP